MVVRSILFLCATDPTKTEMQNLHFHTDRQTETKKNYLFIYLHPGYILSFRVHVCSSEHSDLSFAYRSIYDFDLWLGYVDQRLIFYLFMYLFLHP